MVRSFQVVMGICSFAIAFDRLMAMRKPVQYCHYAALIKRTTIIVLTIALSSSFILLAATRNLKATTGYIFPHFADYTVASALYAGAIIIFFLSVCGKIMFLMEFRRFVKRRTLFTTFQVSNIKLAVQANTIVTAQMIAEIALVICPYVVETLHRYITGISLSAVIGSFLNLTYAFYVTICAVIFYVLSERKNKSTAVSSVTNVSANVNSVK
ncbi:hypothetical protein L596_021363 [Steinernema carpocapsae]|uniref:Uncharacterized protein n=1 Tax=Steinernema carpocapsae TaxID=34508 RepID=A0A4V5ZZY4_STECR|nr:hypothetical protein L596_021363 [Steinernema carpocapsae]